MPPNRPDIVIFVADHYRGEALGHMGNPAVHTPVLDRLVETDAVSFRNAFCQAGVCTPSRCSFMTGWYPHVRGHRTLFHMLRDDEPMLLRTLKQAGYFVWWAGKNDVVPAQHGFEKYCDVKYSPRVSRAAYSFWRRKRGPSDQPGFFSFLAGRLDGQGDADGLYDHDWAMVLGAAEHIKAAAKARPLCIFLPLISPGGPFAVEEPFFSMIDRSKVPLPVSRPDDRSGKPAMLRGIARNNRLSGWGEENFRELRAVYYGMCSRLDHQLGLIIEALKASGRYDETAIFFFSDHAAYVGDYGVVDLSQNTFDDSLTRVPFLIKPPAGTPVRPGVRDALVELVDFPATVEDMLQLEPRHTHFGRSLLPVIAGRTDEHRDAVFAEGGRLHGERHCMELEYAPGHQDPTDIWYPRLILQAGEGGEHGKAVMCRTARHKYVRRLYEQDELYDLAEDPMELNNRIGDPAMRPVLAEMKDRLLKFFVETCDAVPHDTDRR